MSVHFRPARMEEAPREQSLLRDVTKLTDNEWALVPYTLTSNMLLWQFLESSSSEE